MRSFGRHKDQPQLPTPALVLLFLTISLLKPLSASALHFIYPRFTHLVIRRIPRGDASERPSYLNQSQPNGRLHSFSNRVSISESSLANSSVVQLVFLFRPTHDEKYYFLESMSICFDRGTNLQPKEDTQKFEAQFHFHALGRPALPDSDCLEVNVNHHGNTSGVVVPFVPIQPNGGANLRTVIKEVMKDGSTSHIIFDPRTECLSVVWRDAVGKSTNKVRRDFCPYSSGAFSVKKVGVCVKGHSVVQMLELSSGSQLQVEKATDSWLKWRLIVIIGVVVLVATIVTWLNCRSKVSSPETERGGEGEGGEEEGTERGGEDGEETERGGEGGEETERGGEDGEETERGGEGGEETERGGEGGEETERGGEEGTERGGEGGEETERGGEDGEGGTERGGEGGEETERGGEDGEEGTERGGEEGNRSVNLTKEFGNLIGPKKFAYNELMTMTDSFSEDRILGEGGFGIVYKGYTVDTDTPVAIKKLKSGSNRGIKDYISEVKSLGQFSHRNLVRLLGFCHEEDNFALVYEYISEGCLYDHLFKERPLLTWEKRYNIGLGLGSAVRHMQEGGNQYVIHRDIKCSNIMLDGNFKAKLGDFGTARLVDLTGGPKTTEAIGTNGYMAPEYCLTGVASKESDIYSFGVVLLEIVCGRRVFDSELRERHLNLVQWVWKRYGSLSLGGRGELSWHWRNNFLEVVDPRLGEDFDKKQAEALLIVGLWCAHPIAASRPSIEEAMAVLNLKAEPQKLPPKMPRFNFN